MPNKFPYPRDKDYCKVCGDSFVKIPTTIPRAAQRLLKRMENRCVCSVECLLEAFDDWEAYANELEGELNKELEK